MKRKKLFILAAGILVLAFTGCKSKEEEPAAETDTGEVSEEPGLNTEEAQPEKGPVLCMMDLYQDGTEEEKAYARFVDERQFEEETYALGMIQWIPVGKYAFLDINQDGVSELILSGALDTEYYIYTYDKENGKILPLGEVYGGSDDRFLYLKENQSVGKLPADMEGVGGLGMLCEFETIGMRDTGEPYLDHSFLLDVHLNEEGQIQYELYTGPHSESSIEAEELAPLLENAVTVEFSEIPVDLSTDLSQYLGKDIKELEGITGGLQEEEAAEGYKWYKNKDVKALAEAETGIVKGIGLYAGNDYTLEGLRIPSYMMLEWNGYSSWLYEKGWEWQERKEEGEREIRIYSNPDGRIFKMYSKLEDWQIESFWMYDGNVSDVMTFE